MEAIAVVSKKVRVVCGVAGANHHDAVEWRFSGVAARRRAHKVVCSRHFALLWQASGWQRWRERAVLGRLEECHGRPNPRVVLVKVMLRHQSQGR